MSRNELIAFMFKEPQNNAFSHRQIRTYISCSRKKYKLLFITKHEDERFKN